MAGKVMFLWSVEVMIEARCDPVVLPVPEAWVDRAARMIDEEGYAARVEVVAGGDTRQDSVAAGLAALNSEEVLIHDAARPLVTAAMAESVLAPLDETDGAVIGVPVSETLKRVENHVVTSTLDRSRLWFSQTPQAFRTALVKDAHAAAARDRFVATDDAELVERLGGSIAVVPNGSIWNVKVTHAGDLSFADALLRARS